MDRYEYKEMIDRVRSLIEQKEMDEAARRLDETNWRKVPSVNALMKAAELYEEVGRLDSAKELLMLAHERSPIGRMVIYRLALVCIRLKEFDEAREYYAEFLEIAPHDSLRYVINYQLSRARGASDEDLISILEDLKEHDFLEDWALELALFYQKTRQIDKCVNLCNEIILWFGDGPYVEKALELKMIYAPLDPDQEDIYIKLRDKHRDEIKEISNQTEEADREGTSSATMPLPEITIPSAKFNTVNLQEKIKENIEEIMRATAPDQVREKMENIKELTDELPFLRVSEGTRELGVQREQETQKRIDQDLRDRYKGLGIDDDGQISMDVPDRSEDDIQIAGQLSIEDVVKDWEKTRKEAEEALRQAGEKKLASTKAQALVEANEIMERLTGVLPRLEAGASVEDLVEEEMLNHASARLQAAAGAATEDGSKVDYREARKAVSDINSMLQREIDRLSKKEAPVGEAEKAEDKAEVMPETEVAAEAEVDDGPIIPEYDFSEPGQTDAPEGEESESESEEAASETEDGAEEAASETEDGAEEAASETEDTAEEAASEREDEAEEAASETEDTAEEATSEREDEAEEAASETDDTAEEAASSVLGGDISSRFANEEFVIEEEEEEEEAPAPEEVPEQAAEEEPRRDAIEEAFHMQATRASWVTDDQEFNSVESMQASNIFYNNTGANTGEDDLPRKLTDEERDRFSSYVAIEGMEAHLSRALEGVKKSLLGEGKRTHLKIVGFDGSGKTNLATGVIEIMQRQIQLPSGPVGKINADKLNEKNVINLFDRIRGGALIIEKAGDLSRVSVATLNTLLDTDTSGVLMILEGDMDSLQKMFTMNRSFASKFTNEIRIPVFTTDELVAFGRSYAKTNGCTVDSMGILALYNRINMIQKIDQPTSLSEVIEIMDQAMARVKSRGIKGTFSRLGSKKSDAEGRLILHEKDFGA